MDFIDEVRTRSGRFAKRVEHLDTEEATKTSLVLPFIEMMGYSIFDPTEVVPEFTADVGTKKNEKVDYALMQDGKPAVLIECKMYGSNLNQGEMSQLLRYFTVTEARFGILTDGIIYRFFSDLDQPNMMDPKPFFEFNMLDFTEPQIEELKRFTKSAFDMTENVDAARELKYTTEIKRVLADELACPSDDFVRFIIRRVYEGRVATKRVREQFSSLAHQAFTQFINDRINDRLKSALERGDEKEKPSEEQAQPEPEEPEEDGEPEVTPLEVEAFTVIKAILRDTIDVRRLDLSPGRMFGFIYLYKSADKDDAGTLLCRLLFKTRNLRINLPDRPFGTNDPLDDIDSLFDYADRLKDAVKAIESGEDPITEPANTEE